RATRVAAPGRPGGRRTRTQEVGAALTGGADGQGHDEARPGPYASEVTRLPAVPARDLAHQGQPQSRPRADVAAEATERAEHVLALGVGNAGPVVQDGQLGVAVRVTDARLHRRSAVALGIVHE